MQPIVQVEYFHVDLKNGFDTLFEEIAERVHDTMEVVLCGLDPLSSGIKTTIRFYDEDEQITTLVKRLDVLEKEWWQNIRTERPGPVTYYLDRLKRFIRDFRKARLENKLYKNARCVIKQRLATTCGVAGQRADFSFRHIRGEEKHELFQSITRSKKALWFVFVPNDLLSDKNEIMTCYL